MQHQPVLGGKAAAVVERREVDVDREHLQRARSVQCALEAGMRGMQLTGAGVSGGYARAGSG